jgi:hypothetical protein
LPTGGRAADSTGTRQRLQDFAQTLVFELGPSLRRVAENQDAQEPQDVRR